MKPLMPDVNMVSAPAVLKQRGAQFTESRRGHFPCLGSLIRIKVLTGRHWRTLAGVVNAGSAKIVEVKGMPLEADFHPVMLFIIIRQAWFHRSLAPCWRKPISTLRLSTSAASGGQDAICRCRCRSDGAGRRSAEAARVTARTVREGAQILAVGILHECTHYCDRCST